MSGDDSEREEQLADVEEKVEKKKEKKLYTMGRSMSLIKGLICDSEQYLVDENDDTMIKNVCLIVVVDAEIRPIMEKYKFAKNKQLSDKFMNLGVVSSGNVQNLHIDIIKVAESKVFKRHYSGYTQASALAALVSYIIKPDIVISFGTAGGITFLSKSQYHLGNKKSNNDTQNSANGHSKFNTQDIDDILDEIEAHEEKINVNNACVTCSICVDEKDRIDFVNVGDVIFGEACLFLDRLRTRSKNAFDWGLWGGKSLPAKNLCKELRLIKGVVASQIGYMVTKFQSEMIRNANIIALDMECAPIAQILNQTGINFIALKVISNGIYPGSPATMEAEYHENREMVSKKATEILVKVIDFLNNKKIYEL